MESLSQSRAFDQAIHALDAWLRDQDYTRRSRSGIASHIRENGELLGTVPMYLDREHIEPATEVLCESFPDVPPDSEEWADDACWTPDDCFAVSPPELDDDAFDCPDAPDHRATLRPGYRESLVADGINLMPVSGGAPEFVPSEADWADYREYCESIDRAEVLRTIEEWEQLERGE